MKTRRALLLVEREFGGEIDESIVGGFEANGFEVSTLVKGLPWDPEFDIVIGYGPFTHEYGHLLTITRQLLAIPEPQRPLFIWWLTENPPQKWVPPKIAATLAKTRLWGDQRLSSLSPSRLRHYLLKAHRLRVLGQLSWAKEQGVLDILVCTNRARASYYKAHGFDPVVAPLGYHASYGSLLGLERDIDVAFIGQVGTGRRGNILSTVSHQLSRRGVLVEVVSNLYDKERTIFLNRSKIVLNILRSTQDFVGQRLSLAAANGALTVSEPMLDAFPFEPGVHFLTTPWRGLADTIEAALQDAGLRERITAEAHRLVTEELTCEKMVQRILERADKLSTR